MYELCGESSLGARLCGNTKVEKVGGGDEGGGKMEGSGSDLVPQGSSANIRIT